MNKRKKIRTIVTLICISILFCGCSISKSKINEKRENTAETKRYLYDTEKNIATERKITNLSTYKEYKKYIEDNFLSDTIITYEKLDFIGDFDGLVFLSITGMGDYSDYMYSLKDDFGFDLGLYVDHDGEDRELKRDFTVLDKTDISSEDMRACKVKTVSRYSVGDNLIYTYIAGKLSSITWCVNGVKYSLITENGFINYPLEKASFVSALLNCDRAVNVIEDFF